MTDASSIEVANVGTETQQQSSIKRVNLLGLYGSPLSVPVNEMHEIVDALIYSAFNLLEKSIDIDDCEFQWDMRQTIEAGLKTQVISIINDILDPILQQVDYENKIPTVN